MIFIPTMVIPRLTSQTMGPPFDSTAFTEYSHKKGIKRETTYPYHPQANSAERVMKPLGKALKAAHNTHQQPQEALNNFLTGYRSTPHIATGISPGNYLFRNGYRADFPNRKVLTDRDIVSAKAKDILYRSTITSHANTSRRHTSDHFHKGDIVLIKNPVYQRKFDPKYPPTPFSVLDVTKTGLHLERTTDKSTFCRHKDDVKHCTILYQIPTPSDIHYPKPYQGHHEYVTTANPYITIQPNSKTTIQPTNLPELHPQPNEYPGFINIMLLTMNFDQENRYHYSPQHQLTKIITIRKKY